MQYLSYSVNFAIDFACVSLESFNIPEYLISVSRFCLSGSTLFEAYQPFTITELHHLSPGHE